MARKKKTETENGEQTEAPPAAGHNLEQLTDDQRYALTVQHSRKYEASLAAKKKADADHKNICKAAHAELGDTAVDDIQDLIAGKTAEGEKTLMARIKAEEERQKRIARWLGLALGAEPSMFDTDRTPASDRAFAQGKRAGLAGDPCSPTHAPDTEQYRRWMEGFHEGQAVLAQGFKKSIAPEAAKIAAETAARDEAALSH